MYASLPSHRAYTLTNVGLMLQGKDETLVCSLSNFDAYAVTRIHKAPKPYIFAVKSTDNLSFFEEASDYVHIFSCNQKDGELWMQAILLARVCPSLLCQRTAVQLTTSMQSYVLRQERNVLVSKAPPPAAPAGKSLARSGTRKQTPAQPLVHVSPPFSAVVGPAAGNEFTPGTLLGGR